jgi:enoyl-CoA hydratase/carnithine racemase
MPMNQTCSFALSPVKVASCKPWKDIGMELKSTKYEVDRFGVATIMLSRPARRNAWTGRMHTEYRWCCSQAENDPAVRVIIVQGDPEGRAFCVGADATALGGHVERGGYDDGLRGEQANPGYGVHPFLDAHFAWQLGLRVPIIANINGACAGVALALAAFCDIRFVAAEAVLTTAAPKLGLPAEYGLSWILPRIMSRTLATDLLLSGRRFTGIEAINYGFALQPPVSSAAGPTSSPEQTVRNSNRQTESGTLVSKAIESGTLALDNIDATVQRYAHVLATEVSPASLTMTKRQLARDLLRHDVGSSIREADELLAIAMTQPDFTEGVAALQEKRPPRF